MNDSKDTGVGGLFQLPKLFGFGKKKEKSKTESEETEIYPLEKAKENWKTAISYYRSEQYDQATIYFRESLEMLLRANCHGYISSSEKNLTALAKKAFDNIPAEISAALKFINPHYTLVKSVYTAAFADDIYEKAKKVATWIFSQSSYTKFDLDPK
ncbi:MAG TPA: HEPN domain-containing protein [Syntrophaceticus sp.]|nr:HEPN domain-containing protein [Syntrophaceticus sp.]